jgi:uncharacterized Zn finger protein
MRHTQYTTPPGEGDTTPCPACGRPLPADPERHTLLREEEGEPVVYCPCCGAEWGVPDA